MDTCYPFSFVNLTFYLAGVVICIYLLYSVSDYTNLSRSTVTQRQSIAFDAPLSLLQFTLAQLSGDVERSEQQDNKVSLKVFKVINVIWEPKLVVIEVSINYNKNIY